MFAVSRFDARWFKDCNGRAMIGDHERTIDTESTTGSEDATGGESTAGSESTTGGEAAIGSEAAMGGKVIECLIRVGGVDFELVPAARTTSGTRSDVVRSRGAPSTKRKLWKARRAAGLTQAQLAKRLGRSQAMVSQAESGHTYVGERYLRKVLEACELPPEWGQPVGSRAALSDEQIDPSDIAGIDPATCQLVRRGSERDLELGRTFVWWDNYRNETTQDSEESGEPGGGGSEPGGGCEV